MQYEYKTMTYEWIEEELKDGEIVDVMHLDGAPVISDDDDTDWALVCDDWEKDVKSWAYVKNGKLPEFFLNAFNDPVKKVPTRYINEFNKAQEK